MSYRQPTSKELEDSRPARIARQQLARLEVCTDHIERAVQLRVDAGEPRDPRLDEVLSALRSEQLLVRARCSGIVESRHRPRRPASDDATCTIFLDECGQHKVASADPFPVFVLSAVIVRDTDYPLLDAKWKKWKLDNLGSDAIIHEPDVRRRRRPFSGHKGAVAVNKMPTIIEELPFTGITVVVHRGEYMKKWGTGPIDASLPAHAYMMATDMLMERVVRALEDEFGSARARVEAEWRNPKDDALLQYEFARLQLTGTAYISDAFFRELLQPGIRFHGKKTNSSGLQLADLMARPIGEKVANLRRKPDRWDVFRGKLCSHIESKNSILGLKVVPWDARYRSIVKPD
jgi:uncharacterized protein DUF3800